MSIDQKTRRNETSSSQAACAASGVHRKKDPMTLASVKISCATVDIVIWEQRLS
jgi:hypothetical protein